MDHPAPTARLEFRCWNADDLPLAIELWGDANVTALIGGPFSEDMIQERLATELSHQRTCAVQYWPVFLTESGAHAGCAGLRPRNQGSHVYEFGIHLRPAFRGQGLAAEAGHAVIAHAFNTLNAKSLFAGHHPENHASGKLLSHLGFIYTHDELYAPTGLMHPSYILQRSTAFV